MFFKSEGCEIDRSIFRCNWIRCTPGSLAIVDRPINQIFVDMRRKNFVTVSKDSSIETDFKIFHNVSPQKDFEDTDDIRLDNLGRFKLLKQHKMTTSSGEHFNVVGNFAKVL